MGGRSRAAAQLLAGRGFREVYNLKGGIKAWQGLTAVGPAEMGMEPLMGDESPQEIIILAYGMEWGLEEFYAAMAEKASDREVSEILTRLGQVEERHKQRLFDLYLTLDSTQKDRRTFETGILSGRMEGGFTTEEFLERNRDAMGNVSDVIGIAMMLETQALDLYMRYSRKVEDAGSRSVLFEIAEEEKAHLGTLGRLMEAKI